jgi:hypothetical protein
MVKILVIEDDPNVADWNTLLNGPPLFNPQVQQAQQVGEVRPISVSRFRRLLRRIVHTRQTGIFVDQRSKFMKNLAQEIAKIRGRDTFVVDIAKLTDEEQTLVFGDILRTIYALYAEASEEEENLPKKVVILS